MNALQTLTRCLTGLALFLLAACSKDSPGPTAPPPPVASVAVAPNTASLTVGDTMRLVATVKDASGNVLTDRVVEWSSSDHGVATVSSAGLITALNPGTASITGTSEGKTIGTRVAEQLGRASPRDGSELIVQGAGRK